MPTLGETLREARTRKKVRIAQAATDMRVDQARVEALEADNYDAFPDDVYMRGAIRNYALYLDLNPDEALTLYRNARPAAVAVRPLSHVTTTTRLTPVTYATVAVLVVIILIVALLVTHVI
jgi:cytoskeleton protein RodZ